MSRLGLRTHERGRDHPGEALTQAADMQDFDVTKDSRHRAARSAKDLEDWLAWLEVAGRKPSTLAMYEWVAARLLRYYPNKTLAEMTSADVLHVVRSYPAASRRERAAALKSLFEWADLDDRVDRNPFDKLPAIKRRPKKHIEVFRDEEIARLLHLPDRNGELFQILFDTGIRRSEARALQRRDIAANELIVRSGKGGKSRTIDFGPRLHDRLTAWFDEEPLKASDYLWPMRPGGYYLQRNKQMGHTSFITWYTRALAAAEVVYKNPHTTRHTYATRWIRRGGRLETLSKQLGHTSIAITYDYYAHLDKTDVLRDLYVIEGSGK